MGTTTTGRDLLRIGTTTLAYAAGAALVTGGMALVSQAKGADMARIVASRSVAKGAR